MARYLKRTDSTTGQDLEAAVELFGLEPVMVYCMVETFLHRRRSDEDKQEADSELVTAAWYAAKYKEMEERLRYERRREEVDEAEG